MVKQKERKEKNKNQQLYLDCRHYVDADGEELIELQEGVEAAPHI